MKKKIAYCIFIAAFFAVCIVPSAGMLIFGVQSVCQTTFMSLGQAKRSLLIALLRKVVLLAPLAAILPAITGNVMSIYWAEPVSDSLSAATCLIVFLLFIRQGGFNVDRRRA